MEFYTLPDTLSSEINHLEKAINDFKDGKIHPVQLKAIRVPFGVYEQRKEGSFMMRIRCTAGCITPRQFSGVALLAKQFGNNQLHVTTRQELQIHNVDLDNIIPLMKELYTIGLSSRGGGGNTVRNIIASHDSGINPNEVFDVEPYVSALTNQILTEPDSWKLPRKLKISFSSLATGSANVTIQDIGFIANIKEGKRGFEVYLAGGLGANPMVGIPLIPFIPADNIYYVVTAIKRLFDKHGNRKNKHRARLRFLWQKLGKDEFIRLFNQEMTAVKQENHPPLTIPNFENIAVIPKLSPTIVQDEQYQL